MVDDAYPQDKDMDTLHILPLSFIPLQTQSLKTARLVKNSRLQGVVELFSDKDSGSGQVMPDQLHKTFDFSGPRATDLKMIKALAVLPSYDVYSLRIELRKLGIDVDDSAYLRLSDKQIRLLTPYMMAFTKPLIKSIYAGDDVEIETLAELMARFASPDAVEARKNLELMAERLEIEMNEIPGFLRDYGDVYLSLSFYQHCLDENQPRLKDFLKAVQEIRNDTLLKNNHRLVMRCVEVKERLEATLHEVSDVLDIFKLRTAEMWKNLTAKGFQGVNSLITSYQTSMGGALCAITVKMDAWDHLYSGTERTGLIRNADFIMNEMRQGMEMIQPINYADLR